MLMEEMRQGKMKTTIKIFLFWMGLCHLSAVVLANVVELGDIFETESDVVMVKQPAVFVFTKRTFKTGTVVGFKGMFSNISAVKYQVWRPLSDDQYLLVGEKEYTPTRVPAMLEVPLSLYERITVQDGDVLGFAKISSFKSVVAKFDGSTSMGAIYSPTIDVFSMSVNDVVVFDPTHLPLKFSVMALYKPRDGVAQPSSENVDDPPPLKPSAMLKSSTFPPRPPNEGTRAYFGASIFPRESVLDEMSHATFLLPVAMLPSGKLVKFFAYVNRKEAVLLQVWREVSNGVRFKLVGQYHFTPNATGVNEIILDEEDYIPTQLGDCLGFTQLESSSGIGFNFNPNMESALRPIVASQAEAPSDGEIMTFTTLGVPYDFGLGAFVDTDSAVHPEPEPESEPADMEVIVPREPGESILSQSLVSNLASIQTGASSTYLMRSLKFQEFGFITAFSAYTVRNGLIQFQVWRTVGEDDNLFELVGKKDYQVTSAPGLRTVRLADTARISVRPGDFIGLANPSDAGVIGYDMDNQGSRMSQYTSVPDVDVSVGQQVAFYPTNAPYKFSIAVNYVQREQTEPVGHNRFDELPIGHTSSSSNGIQLEEGQKFISQAMEPTTSAISSKASQTYIVATLKFPEGGKLTSISAYVINKGMVQFQIWRQMSLTSFRLVATTNVTVSSGPKFVTVEIPHQIKIREGDMLGFVNAGDKGVIGYKFEESSTGLPVYISSPRLSLPVDHQMEFDLIRLPYKFSLAATYWPDGPSANTSGTAVPPPSEYSHFDPDVMDESQLGPLPETEPFATDPDVTSGIESSSQVPSVFATPPSGKGNTVENDIRASATDGRDVKSTTPDFLLPIRKLGLSEDSKVQAALRPLTSVYLTLVLLLWLIVVTLVLIAGFVFWLYKKKTKRPYNHFNSYRSSSIPSLVGSTDSHKDSLVRFYHSTGLLGGPGFPDSRYDNSSRLESSECDADRTYL